MKRTIMVGWQFAFLLPLRRSKGGDALLKYHLRGQHEVCLQDQAQLESQLRYL